MKARRRLIDTTLSGGLRRFRRFRFEAVPESDRFFASKIEAATRMKANTIVQMKMRVANSIMFHIFGTNESSSRS